MRQIFTFILAFAITTIYSQVADFENYEMEPNNFLNGDDFSGGFISGDIFFPNSYSAAYQFWTGFAISNVQDNSTAGFGNQYASFAGEGAKSSANYAVAYIISPINIQLPPNAKYPVSIYLTNSTYTALSMQEGDQFAKKFGGESGDDPDFYYVTIKSWLNGTLSIDSINHYLADYRSGDNSLDYISNAWDKVDLKSLGESDSLQLTVYSSDVGAFGINTPTYFCLDDLVVQSEPVNTFEESYFDISIYPNPVINYVEIITEIPTEISLFNSTGNCIKKSSDKTKHYWDMIDFPAGVYYLKIRNGKTSVVRKIIIS